MKRSSISNILTTIKRLKEMIEKEGVKLVPDLVSLKSLKDELPDAYHVEPWRKCIVSEKTEKIGGMMVIETQASSMVV